MRALLKTLENLRLAERVEQALRRRLPDAARVEVTVSSRFVILEGRAPSYYLKQVAQAIALGVPGVERVHNEIEVAC